MICEPDKERFCDQRAATNTTLIHTVDLSDERSHGHFITLWLKGDAGDEWARQCGLSDHHNRELYHRDPPWIPAMFPGMQKRGWSKHRHIDLTRPPAADDLERFAEQIPDSILADIKTFLS